MKTDSLCNNILTLLSPFTKGPILFYYILICSKRSPKRRGLSGRLWEVVVYKNRTTGFSSKKSSGHLYFMENISLHETSISQNMYFYVVSNSSSYTLGKKERTVKIQIRPCVKSSLTRSCRLREVRTVRR